MNTCLYFTLGNPFHIQFYTQSYVNIEIAVNTFTCTDVFTAVTTNQNTRISALANIWGGGQWLGMGLLYPGPEYEAIICFTHCKQSKLQVGLGTRLQE